MLASLLTKCLLPLATACVILNQIWDLSTHPRNDSLSLIPSALHVA